MGQDTRQSAHNWTRVTGSRPRVIPRTKAEIAAAVCNGDLSVEEACNCYGLTLVDLLAYLDALAAHGQEPSRNFAPSNGPPVSQSGSDRFRGPYAAAYVPGAMSAKEALNILALQEGASENQIRSAHRSLMKQNHPDRGGSDYLAARINAAKDVLLKRVGFGAHRDWQI